MSSLIHRYADCYGIDRQEAVDHVNAYINRPGEFPRLIEAGLIETTKEARSASIKAYIETEVAIASMLQRERQLNSGDGK
jgi:hypothetical protein